MKTWLLASSILFLSGTLMAEPTDQFDIGQQKAKVCMTCHGVDGISTTDPYPNLRGQRASYFISALKDYKSRERTSGLAILMQQQADALTEQDMKDIAYYYSMLGADNNKNESAK